MEEEPGWSPVLLLERFPPVWSVGSHGDASRMKRAEAHSLVRGIFPLKAGVSTAIMHDGGGVQQNWG